MYVYNVHLYLKLNVYHTKQSWLGALIEQDQITSLQNN